MLHLITPRNPITACSHRVSLINSERHTRADLTTRPLHQVLDMCASRWSTTQALEDLCQGGEGLSCGGGGFIVANELVAARAYVLSKRSTVLGAAAARMAVVCHRAQIFPRGRDGWDRVVCRVPARGTELSGSIGTNGDTGSHTKGVRCTPCSCRSVFELPPSSRSAFPPSCP